MDTLPTSVTVFPDRARVTRTGRVALAVGLQKIEVDTLPLALIQDSVRASGKGASAARAKLAGVSTRLENFVEQHVPLQAQKGEQRANPLQPLHDELLLLRQLLAWRPSLHARTSGRHKIMQRTSCRSPARK